MDLKKKERDLRNNIQKERLIKLVEERPVIWDKFLENYKNKLNREEAWREICLELMPDFEGLRKSDRHLFRTSVIKSWTQMRDAWLKTLQPNRQHRPYIHHKKLLFLLKVINPPKPRQRSDSDSESEDVINVKQENDVSYVDSETEEPSSQNDDNAAKLISFVNQASSSQNVDVNNECRIVSFVDQSTTERHMNFFKSLLPSLSSLDDDQILEFHSAVICALQHTKKRKSSEV